MVKAVYSMGKHELVQGTTIYFQQSPLILTAGGDGHLPKIFGNLHDTRQ